MAICLTETQHASGEKACMPTLRAAFNRLGAQNDPVGTAPLADIIRESKLSIDRIRDLPEECRTLAKTKLDQQVRSQGLKPRQPGRVREKPLPSGDAKTVLERGHY